MGMAPMAYTLWTRFLRHSPTDPGWPNRDRFVSVRRPRQHAPLLAPVSDRLRADDRGPRILPTVGLSHAGPSGARHDPGRRGHDRPARPGFRQRGGHGHRAAPAGDRVQPARPRPDRPLRLRHLLRRRPPGGDLGRGRFPGRTPAARQAGLPVRRQPHPARRPHRDGLHRGRAGSGSTPTAGTLSGSRTATTSRRSTRPSRPLGQTIDPA